MLWTDFARPRALKISNMQYLQGVSFEDHFGLTFSTDSSRLPLITLKNREQKFADRKSKMATNAGQMQQYEKIISELYSDQKYVIHLTVN